MRHTLLLKSVLLVCVLAFTVPLLAQRPNTPPFGWLDEPVAGTSVTGATVRVRGWVLDKEDSAVRVDLLVDGRIVAAAASRGDRPDVCANPIAAGVAHCKPSQPGVSFVWNTFDLDDGPHIVGLRARDPEGAVTQIGATTVIVKNSQAPNTSPFGYLDQPSSDIAVSGPAVPVSGWVLDKEDAKLRVDLIVDGVVIDTSAARDNRPDVCGNAVAAGIGHCNASRPGVSFLWNTLSVSDGSHAVEIRATDPKDASSAGIKRNVVVNNGRSRAQSSSYYVAQTENASDSNDGRSIRAPFRTIQKCAEVAIAGDVCYVRSGVYRETVTPPNSGTAGAPITFIQYNGESVTISGADILSKWSLYQGQIYRTLNMNWDLGRGKNQLFVDGQMMTEARWPNTGPNPSRPTWAVATGGTSRFDHGFGSPLDADERWTITDPALTQPAGFWNGAIINHLGNTGWIAQSGIVTAYTPGTVEFSLLGNRYGVGRNTWYFLTGKLEALDTANEWFFDAASSTAYLWAPASDDPTGHVVEAKKRLYAFDLSGRSYINVVGINLFAATIKTDMDSNNILLDGLNAVYVSHFTVVEGIASGWWAGWDSGIILHGANNTLRNCTIAFSAGNGVDVIGTNHKVTNCIIHEVDYAAVDGAGIYTNARSDARVGMTGFVNRGHEFTYNTLYNSGRGLIFHQYAYGLKILYNYLYNASLQTNDSGFTYTWGTDAEGTEIAFNMMHDNVGTGSGDSSLFFTEFAPGIYLDNGSSSYLIHHNVIWNTRSVAIFMNSPSSNVRVYNNTIWNAASGIIDADSTNNEICNNLADGDFSGNTLRNNFIFADAEFVNSATGNFQLQVSSPAIDRGIVLPGITDDYIGRAPDVGAYEFGATLWLAGANVNDVDIVAQERNAP